MSLHTYSIVGAYYRPPAEALLKVLAIGAPLVLQAEPTNAFDPNAIAIWLRPEVIPETAYPALETELAGYGFTLHDIMGAEAWHVGYIPKALAAVLRANGFPIDAEIAGTFTLSPRGKPEVRYDDDQYRSVT